MYTACRIVSLIRPLCALLATLFALGLLLHATPSAAQISTTYEGFTRETTLDFQEKLDAIRFLQARIIQPESGYYLVRSVSVLQGSDGSQGTFAYLVTYQSDKGSLSTFDLGDFYTVYGFYLVILSRNADEFTLLDELILTPPEILARLNVTEAPPPPDLTDDPEQLDFTGAIFDAMNADVVAWRTNMVQRATPRWEWVDLTGDGFLDCVLDIEGFEFQPSSYYTVLVWTENGFEEGFRSWGYDTDFSEIGGNPQVIYSEQYEFSENGEWLPSWRDYYQWRDDRFLLANANFADSYQGLVPVLEKLADESIAAESDPNGPWTGMTRYATNVTRYANGLGSPFGYYFSLARIAGYIGDTTSEESWWGKVIDYINAEYDLQAETRTEDFHPSVVAVSGAYEEWRDEIYAAAEGALSGE